jgi:uncharacterized protein (DUF952 family)
MILHIVNRETWEAAKAAGEYRAQIEQDGYIHCSTETQMPATANKYYAGQRGLVLLVIDPQRLKSPLKFEPSGNWLLENPGRPHEEYTGELFPHIYGTINPDAVIRVIPYEPDANGVFGTVPV